MAVVRDNQIGFAVSCQAEHVLATVDLNGYAGLLLELRAELLKQTAALRRNDRGNSYDSLCRWLGRNGHGRKQEQTHKANSKLSHLILPRAIATDHSGFGLSGNCVQG